MARDNSLIVLVVVGGLGLLGVLMCGACIIPVAFTGFDLNAEPSEVTSSDGLCTVTIPGNWSRLTDLNDDASLEVGNIFQEAYMVVIVDAKWELPDDFTLEEHSRVTREPLGMTIDEGPSKTTVDGKPALQTRLSGSFEGLSVVYLHTCVESENYYYQILQWTLDSHEESNMPKFRSALASFHETENAQN